MCKALYAIVILEHLSPFGLLAVNGIRNHVSDSSQNSWGDVGLGGAPLQRVQAQIRHKQVPLRATPIYSVLSLSSPPLLTEW